jgi:hypothetical protein
MVRSILPSKSRTLARWAKTAAIREVRRAVNSEIRVQDPELTKADWNRDANQSWNVRTRRGSDKLSHFMRWCTEITRGMTADEALSYVRSLLPKNVIGEHAYGHWEAHRKPEPFHRYHYVPWQRKRQSWIDSTRFHLRRALSEDPALHGRLNAAIKSRKPFDQKRRLLAGLHDIDAFVRDIAEADDYGAERSALRELIEGGPKSRPRCLWIIAGGRAHRLAAAA